MRNTIVVLFGLTISFSVSAQEARSPHELAAQVQRLVATKDINGIARLIHPSAEAASVERLKITLTTFIDAANLKVYPVPKDDKEAVRQFLAQSPVPGVPKPLEERVKKYADNGAFFEIAPLGDLVISGKRVDVASAGSTASVSTISVVYGNQAGKYLIVFAKRK